jgi:hypothetical protein
MEVEKDKGGDPLRSSPAYKFETRDPHRTVYGYDRKDYGYLQVLTERNRNRNDASGASYGYGTCISGHYDRIRSYTVK